MSIYKFIINIHPAAASILKKSILPDVHVQSQLNAPLEFPWPDIHFPVAEATESIPPECFRHRRDCPLIHATRNTVIVRGHFHQLTLQTEYVCFNTLNTF